MKFCLTLNSHSLSRFQECETKYLLNDLINIESIVDKPRMKQGMIVAKFLQLYYYNILKTPRQSFNRALANPILWTNRIIKEVKCSQHEAFELFRLLVSYCNYYRGEDWIPLGVEKGFTKLIYEDDENLFAYEGRPDLIVQCNEKIIVADHKFQSVKYSIYEFNNQCLGYLWATGASEFVYNYLKPTRDENFRREPFRFSSAQIQDWYEKTVRWYWRVKNSIEKGEFLPSLCCSTNYGICQYHKICEQPKDTIKVHVINNQYRKRKPYRSW